MNFQNKSDAVKHAAQGRWLEILHVIAPDLDNAIKRCPHHVPCPVHGGKDGFRLFKDANLTGGGISNADGAKSNGFELLMWLFDCDFKTVLNDVADYLGINKWKNQAISPKAVKHSNDYHDVAQIDERTMDKRRLALRKTWKQSFCLDSPKAQLARQYLTNRGINLAMMNLAGLSKTMRFHPSLELWHNQKCVGRYPALISMVSYSDGEPASLHRTYLDNQGRKLALVIDGESIKSKKLMSRCTNRSLSGGAIRFGIAQDTLHLTEGIETALSVMQAKGEAVWPCVSSTLLAKFEPPEGVTHLFVWADKDRKKVLDNGEVRQAGLDSAMELFERMEAKGVNVTILLPDDDIPDNSKSVDWNDVLVKHGEHAFPAHSLYLWQ